MDNAQIFLLSSIPEKLDYYLFIKAALGKPFGFYHDFATSKTYLILEENDSIEKFLNSMPGIELKKSTFAIKSKQFLRIVPYFDITFDEKHQPEQKFKEVYSVLRNKNSSFFIFFIPSNILHAKEVKEKLEERLSSMEIRVNRQSSSRNISSGTSESVQSEL